MYNQDAQSTLGQKTINKIIYASITPCILALFVYSLFCLPSALVNSAIELENFMAEIIIPIASITTEYLVHTNINLTPDDFYQFQKKSA